MTYYTYGDHITNIKQKNRINVLYTYILHIRS